MILVELSRQFANYLLDKTCKIISSPVDVVFPDSNKDIKDAKDVVQPDIIIVCDHKKIKSHKHCVGSPDLIIEILSPSTSKLDLKDKLKLYERECVKEYWIVFPNDKIKAGIFPDLEIDLSLVFREYIQEE